MHFRRVGRRRHFCHPIRRRTRSQGRSRLLSRKVDDLAIHAGLRTGCVHRAPQAAHRHISGGGNGAGRCGRNARFRHGLPDRDALGAAALRRNAGLCQHAARGGRNAAPDAGQRGGDSRQPCVQLFPDFRQMRFPGDGCNRRGDCDGAFPLYRNGDYRGLYAYPKGIFSLYSRRIPQSARSESPDERHFAPGHAAAGQRIFVVIRHGGAASVLFRARA